MSQKPPKKLSRGIGTTSSHCSESSFSKLFDSKNALSGDGRNRWTLSDFSGAGHHEERKSRVFSVTMPNSRHFPETFGGGCCW
jgi:hypothetical protein